MMEMLKSWSNNLDKWAPIVARVLVAIVFLYAGYQKISNFEQFIVNLNQLPLLSGTTFAVLVIIFEIVGGLALLVGFKTKIASYLLILFMIVSGIIIATGFKLSTPVVWNVLIVINLGIK